MVGTGRDVATSSQTMRTLCSASRESSSFKIKRTLSRSIRKPFISKFWCITLYHKYLQEDSFMAIARTSLSEILGVLHDKPNFFKILSNRTIDKLTLWLADRTDNVSLGESPLLKYCWITSSLFVKTTLTLLWRRPLSYRNQSTDLQSKSMNWFLYDRGLRHDRVIEVNDTC